MAASTAKYRLTGVEAANVLKSSGGETPTVTKVPLHMPNGCKWETDITEIEFEGANQKARVYIESGLAAELGLETFDLAGMSGMYGLNKVTTSLPGGAVERTYGGTNAEASGVRGGLEVISRAINLTTNTPCLVAVTAPLGTFSPMSLGEMKTLAKAGMTAKFSADKTSVDIAGTALPGVPTGGCFWYIDELPA